MDRRYKKKKRSYRKYNNNQKDYMSKLINQLIVASFILLLVVGIKNIDTALTNKISDKIDNTINYTIDLQNTYDAVETFTNKIGIGDKDTTEVNSDKEENITINEEDKKVNTFDNIKEKILSITELEEKKTVEENIVSIEAMQIPVNGIVSSPFGNRIHPLFDKELFHSGIDIEADEGTDILSPLSGKVIETGDSNTYGNYIRITHTDKIVTFYAHCKDISVNKGDILKKGEKIGTVGSTGSSSGAHLHFEIIYDGKYVDPLNYINLPIVNDLDVEV
jgi:murein DD-endopeptidase MepM/ murein hydrolase activator NlpD